MILKSTSHIAATNRSILFTIRQYFSHQQISISLRHSVIFPYQRQCRYTLSSRAKYLDWLALNSWHVLTSSHRHYASYFCFSSIVTVIVCFLWLVHKSWMSIPLDILPILTFYMFMHQVPRLAPMLRELPSGEFSQLISFIQVYSYNCLDESLWALLYLYGRSNAKGTALLQYM